MCECGETTHCSAKLLETSKDEIMQKATIINITHIGIDVGAPNITIGIGLKKREIDTSEFFEIHIRRLGQLRAIIELPTRFVGCGGEVCRR